MAALRHRRQQFPSVVAFRCAHAVFAALLTAAVLDSACTSSAVSVAGPSGSKCQVDVTNSMQSAPPSGGSGTLTITTSRDCTWAASSGVAWIVITSGSSGQGNGSAAFRIAANTDASQRRGSIEVNSTEVAITQDAACRYQVSAATTAVPMEGGTVAVNVQSSGTCGWTAASQVGWITVADGSTGSGNGVVTLNVAPNGGASRAGTVLVAGQTITITQGQGQPGAPGPPPPPSCDSSISPAAQAFGADAATGTVSVTVAAGCSWTAVANVDWLSIVSGASGAGPGQVRFNVAANASASTRQGTLTIAGRMFSIAQAGVSCGYAIPQPASATFSAGGGNGSFVVATNNACTWTAKSDASWISITGGASGHGSGTISFAVSPNTGAARTGTMTVEKQTFTVTQATCAFTVTAPTQSFPDAGGTGSANVATDSVCAWTASSNADWIKISATSGAGNGAVNFTVVANTGAARTGTLTVAGQTITLSQAAPAPCTFTIAPTAQSLSDVGGTGSVAVTASAASCPWTAASNAGWIAITSGPPAPGSGTVAFSVAANMGAARSGTLTIAGQTFTVDQAAPPPPPPPPCTFSIAPPGQNVPAAGGTGSVTVTASAATCAWTAASAVDWIAITAPGPGQGSGTVEFTIAPNAGPPRSGTLTVAGQVFTVNQEGVSQGGS